MKTYYETGIIFLILSVFCFGMASGDSPSSNETEWIFSTMTPEERVGQVFMPAISSLSGNGTLEMTPELKAMLKEVHPGGIILFARDISSVEQVVTLTDSIQKEGPILENGEKIPLFISIDQEGGQIARLPFGPRMPGNMALGASRSPEITREVAQTVGDELSSLGINMNFAPVLDVETNQNNPVIGIRSFGADPDLVAELGDAYIAGMHDAGIICSGKHFPGHGDVDIDSHLGLPLEKHNRTRMNEVELVPFKSAISAGVDAIMTAHIIFPAYDNSTNLLEDGTEIATPATLSEPILTGLLRDELSFDGLIITDAMMMKAIVDNFKTGDAAVRAVRAGADIILYPDPVDEAYNALLEAYKSDPEIRARVDESVKRILAMKEKYRIIDNSSSGEHQIQNLSAQIVHAQDICLGEKSFTVEREAAEKTVTLVSDIHTMIPLSFSDVRNIVVFSPSDSFTKEITQVLNETMSEKDHGVNISSFTYTDTEYLSDTERNAVSNASLVLLGTISTNATQRSDDYYIPKFSHDVLEISSTYQVPVIGLALNQPYDIMYMQDIPVYFATYAGKAGGQNVKSAIKAIFGEIPISGVLPVDIKDINGREIYQMGTG